MSVYIIAEIGSNHDLDLNRAKGLIDMAKSTGANAVKFQLFKAEKLLSNKKLSGEINPAYEVIKNLELPESWIEVLKNKCLDANIDFMLTFFDIENLIKYHKYSEIIKISSGDLTFTTLLEKINTLKKKVFLSTGMAYLDEVKTAVEILKDSALSLLHCTSLYPPKQDEINIKVITTLKNTFSLPVGFSDHSLDDTATLAAVALGAEIIEKHITDDRKRAGPDHPFAMEINKFSKMVKKIRYLEKALGNNKKTPSTGEKEERIYARRGIWAKNNIKKDQIIKFEDLKFIRPKGDIGTEEANSIIGKKAKVDIPKNSELKKEYI